MNRLYSGVLVLAILLAGVGTAAEIETPETKELKAKIESLEEAIVRLEIEIDAMKAQNRAMNARTSTDFYNATYFRAGGSLLIPRKRTFDFSADTGIGLFAGLGQYLGTNHVFDFSLEWDVYIALSLRYRYEFHLRNPMLTFGPVVGYKIRALSVGPFDRFLDSPDQVISSFYLAGAIVEFPIIGSLIAIELLYMFNTQAFFLMTAGVHFFL